jgi:hypothetical protein
MRIRATLCPEITSPCAQLPQFAPGQKRAFCQLCCKQVHNLSAMTLTEQTQLYETQANACVRYARLVPAAILLLSSASAVLAQDGDTDNVKLEEVTVVGGGRGPYVESVFLQSDLDDDVSLDDNSHQEHQR